MNDEREYWRSAIVGRTNKQQPIYAGELLDELVDLRAQLAEANAHIEALEAGLTRIAAGKLWRYITDVCVCQWCGQPGEEENIEHFACCPSVIAKKAQEVSK